MNIDKKHLDLLNKRVARLIEEINIDAPKIIIKNELKLIKDFDEKMRDNLKKQYEQIQVNAMKVKLKAAQSVAVAKSKIIAKLGL